MITLCKFKHSRVQFTIQSFQSNLWSHNNSNRVEAKIFALTRFGYQPMDAKFPIQTAVPRITKPLKSFQGSQTKRRHHDFKLRGRLNFRHRQTRFHAIDKEELIDFTETLSTHIKFFFFFFTDNGNKVSEDIQTRACNNETCNNHCRRLGFKVGRCVSANVCRCNK